MKNKQALINVAEWLENGAKHVETPTGHNIGKFDMEQAVNYDYADGCGTACCIAGAIVQFENLINPVLVREEVGFFDLLDASGKIVERGIGNLVSEHLGLTEEETDKLFTPWNHFPSDTVYEFSDPDRAAKVIRYYLETGLVDWDEFPASPEYQEDEEYWEDE